MSTTFATQKPNTASLISHAFLFVRCAMLLSSPLSATAPASATPFPHLDHETSQIVKEIHDEQRSSQGTWSIVNE